MTDKLSQRIKDISTDMRKDRVVEWTDRSLLNLWAARLDQIAFDLSAAQPDSANREADRPTIKQSFPWEAVSMGHDVIDMRRPDPAKDLLIMDAIGGCLAVVWGGLERNVDEVADTIVDAVNAYASGPAAQPHPHAEEAVIDLSAFENVKRYSWYTQAEDVNGGGVDYRDYWLLLAELRRVRERE